MSASLKSGMAGNRDAFAAYICDDNALDVLRPVVIELGWQPEKCNKGGLRNAIQSLSVSASPNILMVDLSESGDPLNDINALAEVCEPGTVVIAIGQVNDVRLTAWGVSHTTLEDVFLKLAQEESDQKAADKERKAKQVRPIKGPSKEVTVKLPREGGQKLGLRHAQR